MNFFCFFNCMIGGKTNKFENKNTEALQEVSGKNQSNQLKAPISTVPWSTIQKIPEKQGRSVELLQRTSSQKSQSQNEEEVLTQSQNGAQYDSPSAENSSISNPLQKNEIKEENPALDQKGLSSEGSIPIGNPLLENNNKKDDDIPELKNAHPEEMERKIDTLKVPYSTKDRYSEQKEQIKSSLPCVPKNEFKEKNSNKKIERRNSLPDNKENFDEQNNTTITRKNSLPSYKKLDEIYEKEFKKKNQSYRSFYVSLGNQQEKMHIKALMVTNKVDVYDEKGNIIESKQQQTFSNEVPSRVEFVERKDGRIYETIGEIMLTPGIHPVANSRGTIRLTCKNDDARKTKEKFENVYDITVSGKWVKTRGGTELQVDRLQVNKFHGIPGEYLNQKDYEKLKNTGFFFWNSKGLNFKSIHSNFDRVFHHNNTVTPDNSSWVDRLLEYFGI